ncbi:ATP-dependent DNA helicase [Trichonephila clavata]|uniref:ATP-dependent DNA helicase n=1 Tax=Trichonephila clavata TaxID=2740835 RepID=A0A8X6HV13_TRICU|nr:ATP-dependent DNA helicase [Trichonephila clavata]
MNFEPFYAKQVGDNEESIDAEKDEQPRNQRPINLANNTKRVIKKVPTVIRVPFVHMPTEPENYFYSLLVEYIATTEKESELFGGINTRVSGDLFQLPPIRGAQAFHQPERFYPANHLWRLFSLFELTENMRQQGVSIFADLLNALHVGELKAPHFTLLESKMLTETSGIFDLDRVAQLVLKLMHTTQLSLIDIEPKKYSFLKFSLRMF